MSFVLCPWSFVIGLSRHQGQRTDDKGLMTNNYLSSGALPVITSSAETCTARSGAFWTIRISRWCLVLLRGRHSAISTVSPSRASFFSSWACSTVRRLRYLPYLGCRVWYATTTLIVLSRLSDAT